MTAAVAIVLVFGGLILFHELGHFLMAKRAGVRVDEFALGFGPRVAGVRRGETEYSVRLLPLGGFVRMAGMYPLRDENLPPVPPGRGFNDQSVRQRAGIVMAGPVMNLLLAWVLLTAVLAAVGVPRPTLEVARVEPGLPAAAAGLRPGDVVLAIDGRRLAGWEDLQQTVSAHPGRRLVFRVRRDGAERDVPVTPEAREGGRGFVGIVPATRVQQVSLARAVPEGARWTYGILALTVEGAASALAGRGTSEILGPVGIGQQIGEASRMGLGYLMVLAAVLSANLGLLNLLPIPALDGSWLLFLGVEAIRGRPVDPEKQGIINFIGFAFMMLLLLMVTYRDLLRLSSG